MKTPTKKEIFEVSNNYLMITLGYNDGIILPYDDGVKLLACLKKAETYDNSYRNEGIKPLKGVKSEIVSSLDYSDIKMATLLGIPLEELIESRLKETNEEN